MCLAAKRAKQLVVMAGLEWVRSVRTAATSLNCIGWLFIAPTQVASSHVTFRMKARKTNRKEPPSIFAGMLNLTFFAVSRCLPWRRKHASQVTGRPQLRPSLWVRGSESRTYTWP